MKIWMNTNYDSAYDEFGINLYVSKKDSLNDMWSFTSTLEKSPEGIQLTVDDDGTEKLIVPIDNYNEGYEAYTRKEIEIGNPYAKCVYVVAIRDHDECSEDFKLTTFLAGYDAFKYWFSETRRMFADVPESSLAYWYKADGSQGVGHNGRVCELRCVDITEAN